MRHAMMTHDGVSYSEWYESWLWKQQSSWAWRSAVPRNRVEKRRNHVETVAVLSIGVFTRPTWAIWPNWASL